MSWKLHACFLRKAPIPYSVNCGLFEGTGSDDLLVRYMYLVKKLLLAVQDLSLDRLRCDLLKFGTGPYTPYG